MKQTRTESRITQQSELDTLSTKVKQAPHGTKRSWQRHQVRKVAEMLKREMAA